MKTPTTLLKQAKPPDKRIDFLKLLVQNSQTPKGLNEQGLNEMIKKGTYKNIIKTLDAIHKRINK